MPGLRQSGKTQGRPSSLPQVRHTGRAFFFAGRRPGERGAEPARVRPRFPAVFLGGLREAGARPCVLCRSHGAGRPFCGGDGIPRSPRRRPLCCAEHADRARKRCRVQEGPRPARIFSSLLYKDGGRASAGPFSGLRFFRQGRATGRERSERCFRWPAPAPTDAGAFPSLEPEEGFPRGGSLRRPVPSVPEAGPRAVKTSGRRYTVFFPCLPGKRRAVQGADGRVFRQKRGRSGRKAGEGGCGPVRSAGKRPAKGKNTESSACTALCGSQRGGFFPRCFIIMR